MTDKQPQHKILLADDDAMIREVIHRILSLHGYDVTEAEDGEVALHKLQEGEFDLLITDIVMPSREGLELILEVKKKMPELKILAMSAGGRADPDEYLRYAKAFGANEVLPKPSPSEDIIQAVKRLLTPS